MADQDTYGSGTNEFLGIVLKYESQKEQQNGDEGVGYRYRVAVMGNHPSDETVKDTDIIYAMVALGVSDGTGAGGRKQHQQYHKVMLLWVDLWMVIGNKILLSQTF